MYYTQAIEQLKETRRTNLKLASTLLSKEDIVNFDVPDHWEPSPLYENCHWKKAIPHPPGSVLAILLRADKGGKIGPFENDLNKKVVLYSGRCTVIHDGEIIELKRDEPLFVPKFHICNGRFPEESVLYIEWYEDDKVF